MFEAAVYMVSSFWFGALHAATPGHGKTVAAAYLVGARGRPVDAVTLGLIVTLSHTLGIVLFAVVATLGSAATLPRVLEQYVALGIAALIVSLGIGMLWSQRHWLLDRLARTQLDAGSEIVAGVDHLDGRAEHHYLPLLPRSMQALVGHAGPVVVNAAAASSVPQRLPSADQVDVLDRSMLQSGQSAHLKDDWHRHGLWGHRHSHANLTTTTAQPPSLGLLVGLGIAGGVMPDPGALAVLLSALSSGRLVLGLVTVLVYSLGFATMLVLAGMVAGRVGVLVLDRWSAKCWVEWLQFASSLVITGYGIVLFVTALRMTA